MPDSAPEIRILFLEDSAIDAELVVQHLRARPDFSVLWVNHRAAFVAALKDQEFDLVLVDYSLPEFEGLQALQLALEYRGDTPVVFISGVSGEEFATEAIAQGATDYVVKRSLHRLPAVLDRALQVGQERNRRLQAEAALRILYETREKQIELRTRERNRIWRLSRDLFVVLDRHGVLIAANPACWRILGVQEDQLLATSIRALVHEEDIPHLDNMLEALRSNQPVEHAEMRMRRRDGEYRLISWTAVPQDDDVYAVGRDITEAKQAALDLEQATATIKSEEEERLRVEANLQHLQRVEAIGQIAAGVAHDFNNLLAVIRGNTVLLERTLGPQGGAKALGHLGQISRAVEGATRVTRQLLEFSRPQPIKPRMLDLNQAVAGIGDLLKSSLSSAIQLQTELHEALWSTWADRTQLEMALLNLVVNARDAMSDGGQIQVRTGHVRFDAGIAPKGLAAGDYVSVSVADSGAGMPPEVVERAFEPFFTTKGPGRGSGLGLAQVSDFARRSGGAVEIESRPGSGTTVRIFLPRAIPPEKSGESVLPAPFRSSALHTGSVLVVDDDPAARAVTASIIREDGHMVYEADSGPAALEIIKNRPIDVLVSDYAMPGMNGAQTARLARTVNPRLPIVFLTGYADIAGLNRLIEHRLLEKPCRDEELREAISAALQDQTSTVPQSDRR